jgi:hypothetical protein
MVSRQLKRVDKRYLAVVESAPIRPPEPSAAT